MHQCAKISLSIGVLAGLLATNAGTALAQQLPSPYSLASQLDLECHKASGLPPAPSVWIHQLNPVLQGHLPNQQAQLGELEDVCVPVAKNQKIPSDDALPIARWVDLACYRAEAPPVDVDVDLSHLNPELADLPDEHVKIVNLEQLCVPVMKKGKEAVVPPVWVHETVRHFDFACYALEEPTPDVNFPLTLTHLNPVIRDMNLEDRSVRMRRARQLCVPIRKGAEEVPAAVEALVRWIDFLKYRLTPATAAAVPAVQAPIPLELKHINPMFAHLPPFTTVLTAPLKLLVPVAKDNWYPPM